jgi:hypothetical protein
MSKISKELRGAKGQDSLASRFMSRTIFLNLFLDGSNVVMMWTMSLNNETSIASMKGLGLCSLKISGTATHLLKALAFKHSSQLQGTLRLCISRKVVRKTSE